MFFCDQEKKYFQAIRVVIMARDLTIAHTHLEALKRKRFSHPAHKTLLQDFYRDVDTLTTYLQYPHLNIPRTNNDIENLFRQLNQRLVSICRFGTFIYAQNYLTAWILM